MREFKQNLTKMFYINEMLINVFEFQAVCSEMYRRACWPGNCYLSGLGRNCKCDAGFVSKAESAENVHCLCK